MMEELQDASWKNTMQNQTVWGEWELMNSSKYVSAEKGVAVFLVEEIFLSLVFFLYW